MQVTWTEESYLVETNAMSKQEIAIIYFELSAILYQCCMAVGFEAVERNVKKLH